MPEPNLHKLKNYFLNVLIVLLAVLTFYLFYSFIKRSTTNQSDVKIETKDTSASQLTRQPSNQTLQIDVQNGTGVQGLGNKFMEYLRSSGFDVVEMGNFSSSDIKTSMVIDRAGNMKNAARVASTLGISDKYVIQQVNKNYFLDATVVIGRDYNELNPFKQNQNNNTNNTH
jgi:calcineurin-like phosphoesterase